MLHIKAAVFEDIEKINIKEDLIIKLKDNGIGKITHHIPFVRLNDYMRSACNACEDFTNIYADVSFGGLGSPDEFTTVITRTEKGKRIISKAIEAEIIDSIDLNSQAKRKMIDLITRYSQLKVKRKDNFMKDRSMEFKKRLKADLYSAN